MKIGELGAAAGVDVETIRWYERVGLLPAPSRSANGYRAYGRAHLERLAFVRHCRHLDMGLPDVRRLLELLDRPAADCGDADRLVDEQIERVRARLASLRALERQLVALRAKCRAPHAAAQCGVLGELVAAAREETGGGARPCARAGHGAQVGRGASGGPPSVRAARPARTALDRREDRS